MLPLTGPLGWVGALCAQAIEAALALARERTAVAVRLLPPVDGSDAASAAAGVARLADAGARAVFGTVFSAPALAASAVAHERGLFYVEIAAAAPELTRRGHPHLIRFNTDAPAYGRAGADVLALACGAPAAARVAIVQQEDPFCAAFAAGLRARAAEHRLPVVAHETFAAGADIAARAAAAVERAAVSRPAAAVLVGFKLALAPLWLTCRERLPGVRVVVGNGEWTVRPPHAAGRLDLEGMLVVDTPHFEGLPRTAIGAAGRAQHTAFAARRGPAPPGFDMPVDPDLAFLAASTFFERILPAAASAGAAALRAAAAQVDVPVGDTLVGYGVKFDARGDNERSFPVVLQWQDGRRPVVFPGALATAAMAPGTPAPGSRSGR